MPIKSLTRVLLPAPFSPQMARISPSPRESETPRNACTAPKLLLRSRAARTSFIVDRDSERSRSHGPTHQEHGPSHLSRLARVTASTGGYSCLTSVLPLK